MVTAERPKLSLEGSLDEPMETKSVAFPLRLQLPVEWELTDEQLLELALLNEEWYLEADCEGGLYMAPPPGPLSAERELLIASQILFWSSTSNRGRVFPSATFRLPNGWRRAPDAAWISDERLSGIAPDNESIWAVCPDFVVEVRSVNDRLPPVQTKMKMWIAQGARLGWLVDPHNEVVWVYMEEEDPRRLERPESVTASEIAEDLTVDFSRIWPRHDPEPGTS